MVQEATEETGRAEERRRGKWKERRPLHMAASVQYCRPANVVVVVCIRSHNWSARQRHHRLQSVV